MSKLVSRGYKVVIAERINGELRERTIEPPAEELNVDEETGEVLPVEEMKKFDGDIEEPKLPVAQNDSDEEDALNFDPKAFDPEALCVLDELFGQIMILR